MEGEIAMREIHFLHLSKKVTINLDKVMYVQWADRDDFAPCARITYESGKTEYYRGAEAKALKHSLNFDACEKKT